MHGDSQNVRCLALVSKLTGYFDLGDIVMSNSLVRYVRQRFPQARIVLFARADEIARYKDRFYSGHSWIDEFCECPESTEKSWRKWLRLWLRLRSLRADLCITNIESLPAWFVFLAGIPRRVGVPPANRWLARLLTHPVNIRAQAAAAVHWTDVAAAYMRALGAPQSSQVQQLVPYVRYEKEDAELTEAGFRGPIVVMHIGGAVHWNRRWPRESYLEICVRLSKQLAAAIVFVCGSEERAEIEWLMDRLRRLCPSARVRAFAGCSLNRILSVYGGATLYVGNDSGLMHLAVATGLPVVALFGPSDHRYLGPDRVDPRHQVVTRSFPCAGGGCRQGCRTHYEIDSPDYPACMKGIEVARVWEAITRRVGRVALTGAG